MTAGRLTARNDTERTPGSVPLVDAGQLVVGIAAFRPLQDRGNTPVRDGVTGQVRTW